MRELHEGQWSVLEATSRDDLFRVLQRLSSCLGFEMFSASAVVDHFVGTPAVVVTVGNTPADYCEACNDPALGRLDPVMQHVKARSDPIAWDQSTYVKAGRMESKPADRPRRNYPHARSVADVCGVRPGRIDEHPVAGVLRAGAAPADVKRAGTMQWTLDGKTAWETGRILGIAEDTVARHAHSPPRSLAAPASITQR